MLVRVAVNVNIGQQQGFLDYEVPKTLEQQVQIGMRIQAPVGKGGRHIQGYIVGMAEPMPTVHYRTLETLLDQTSLLDAKLVQLAMWISKRYVCSCYYVLEYILPLYARQQQKMLYRWCGDEERYRQTLLAGSDADRLVDFLKKQPQTEYALKKALGKGFKDNLEQLIELGLIEKVCVFAQKGQALTTQCYKSLVAIEALQTDTIENLIKRAPKQKELLWYLTYEGPKQIVELRRKWSNAAGLLRELQQKALISVTHVTVERSGKLAETFYNPVDIVLNADQQAAVTQIDHWLEQGEYQVALIQGVTGSGKTEVYLKAVEKALSLGKGALILVPEIALTPQLLGRFKGRLQVPVEVMHSNLSDGERYDVWQNLRMGKVKVVVGVRSAIFAPIQNLGLIVMDEEHESTFKQSEPDPRYHARDVALERGRMENALVLLGSATPAVESYYKAMEGTYRHIILDKRAKAQPMPEVEIVDMGQAFQKGEKSIFSLRLREAMEAHLRRGEQVILFLNRRGFARSVLCRECGHTMVCPKCSIAMTYHKHNHVLKCHYCDYLLPLPETCPKCGSRFIRHFGSGTEQVAEELSKLWPWIKVLRMDRDTTQNKGAHQQILEQFAKGDAQVLIGTQMITKGLDFPNVTLVGVIAADLTLNLPDYSAAEHCFQLLTQVAGRAGRGDKEGLVIIQTYNPDHYSIQTAKGHDYETFYQHEIKNRQLMNYPPFSYMIRILLTDYHRQESEQLLDGVAKLFAERFPDIELLGPTEAPIEKIRDRYRMHMVLKHSELARLLEAVECGQKYMDVSRKSKTLRIIVDVEPQSIL